MLTVQKSHTTQLLNYTRIFTSLHHPQGTGMKMCPCEDVHLYLLHIAFASDLLGILTQKSASRPDIGCSTTLPKWISVFLINFAKKCFSKVTQLSPTHANTFKLTLLLPTHAYAYPITKLEYLIYKSSITDKYYLFYNVQSKPNHNITHHNMHF